MVDSVSERDVDLEINGRVGDRVFGGKIDGKSFDLFREFINGVSIRRDSRAAAERDDRSARIDRMKAWGAKARRAVVD